MKKRILPIIMIVSLLLSIVVPVSASSGGYAVYAFSGGIGSGSYSGGFLTSLETSSITPGQALFYPAITRVCGYFVYIPPSTIGGYLFVLGYYPIRVGGQSGNASGQAWRSAFAAGNYSFLAPYYQFQSAIAPPYVNDDKGAVGTPFEGFVYVPPHTDPIYLLVYGITDNNVAGGGCLSVASASVQFVPDSTENSSLLQQIVTQVTNIKNEITSTAEQNQNAQQILDQMDSLLTQIDELTQQIEDVTVRPPPDTILPSPPADLLPPVDPAGQLGFEAVTSILSLPLILSFLLMVFTLALIRYVLFGKS